MEKRENKSTKKDLLLRDSFSLTRTESEVLSMITDEFLTMKQIRIRRDCSKQAVYKIVKSLRLKGALTIVNQKGGSSQPNNQRLHAQQFRIRIINKSSKYDEILKKSNLIKIDENTIILNKDIIEIYSGKSFFGINEQDATSKSLDYWYRFISRLENEFNVILQKPRTQNIKFVKKGHYAEINSELAKESEKSGEEVKVYCKDDGKLSVVMDNSFNLHERECIHPERSKYHSEAITKQISDFIENNPPTNSQIASLIGENTQNIGELSKVMNNTLKDFPTVLNGLKEQISSHLALINEYRKENVLWRKNKEKEIRKQLKDGFQATLGDFI